MNNFNGTLTGIRSFFLAGFTEVNKLSGWLIFLCFFSALSSAQQFTKPFKIIDPEIVDKYKYMYKETDAGDSFDPASGNVTFSVTDISIPGNFSIPVELERWVAADDFQVGGLGAGGWNWNIPLIKANYIRKNPYIVANGDIINSDDGWYAGKNCTQGPSSNIWVSAREFSHEIDGSFYWTGKQLHIPGKTTEKFLLGTGESPYLSGKQVTKSNYYVSECTTLNNNEEGFVVKGPDGLTYTFGEVRSYYTGAASPTLTSPATTFTKLILITSIQDRFGNSVSYQYNGPSGLLSRIEATDGRYIDIVYKSYTYKNQTRYIADYAETNGKRWVYTYQGVQLDLSHPDLVQFLHKVTLPDGSAWEYDTKISKLAYNPTGSHTQPNYDPVSKKNYAGACGAIRTSNPESFRSPFTTTVTAPSGAKTLYSFDVIYKGRSKVAPMVELIASPDSVAMGALVHYQRARNMNCEAGFSLVEKKISGSNLTEQKWSYSYSQNRGTYTVENPCALINWSGDCGNLNSNQTGDPKLTFLNSKPDALQDVEDYRSVSVTGPDTKIIYYVDRKFKSPTEGSVIAEDHLTPSTNALLKRVEYEYGKGIFIGNAWADDIGHTMDGYWVALGINKDLLSYRVNKLKVKTTLYQANEKSSYYSNYGFYDDFGFAKTTTESNSFSTYKRYLNQTYLHDKTAWLIGLPAIKSVSSDNISFANIEEIVYHSVDNTALYPGLYLPYEYKSFGTWLRRYPEYHSGGQLKRIEYNQPLRNSDGALVATKNRYQILNNYKRGKAQTIQVAQRYSDLLDMSFSRTVNDDGLVTSITDLNGGTVYYGYDLVGRVKYVDLPSGWSDTFIEWQESVGTPIKRVVRSCQLTATKSNCEVGTITLESTSEFDALYRVVKTDDNDLLSSTHRYQNFSFNSLHLPTFISHKSASVSESSGTTNVYDSLGRLTSSSLSGGGTVSREYMAGNKVRVTDAEENQTTVSYLAYGTPEYSQSVSTSSPESVTTTQAINIFGNITSITQTGPGKDGVGTVNLTEYRAYDAQQNLCKIVRSDVGTTAYSNSLLGEVEWQAQGVSGNSNNDCSNNATSDKKIHFVYDNLGDKWKVDFPNVALNPADDIVYTLDNNGNIKRLVTGQVTQTYNYNILDLLEDEQLQVNGKSFVLDYGYNSAGHLSSLTYPDSDKVNFNPNGFGEARQVIRQARTGRSLFNYATEATYYPSGQIDTFNYGNGLVHKTTLNNRMIPDSVKDNRTGLTALHYGYTYDDNLKITSITDHADTNYSITNLAYDGLGRLTSTTGNTGIGGSLMKYDGLGNITYYKNKKHTLDYTYGANNRLQSVASSGAIAKPYSSFVYDDRGNVTNNSYRGFDYNRANQMVVSGNNQYVYDGYNRRVMSVEAGKTSYSFYSQSGKLLYSEDSEGGINYVFLGKKLIAKDGFIPQNTAKQHYLPYGSSVEGEINNVGYTGHKFDTSIGLSYMQARYYDPVIGRFYSNDPIGFTGDVETFNRYSYVGNDPVNQIDPDGKFAVLLLFAPEIVVATKAILFVGSAATVAAVASDAIDTGGESNDASSSDTPDFVVDSNGTAVPGTVEGIRGELDGAGYVGEQTTETQEDGTIHKGVPGKDGPMDVRVMGGQQNPGDFKGPRVRTTASGTNDGVKSDGSKFRNNETKEERLKDSHIHIAPRK